MSGGWQGKLEQLVGLYESAARSPGASLTCRVQGDAGWLQRGSVDPERASTVRVAEDAFGLGIGAIGSQFTDAAPRMGELIAAAGVVAYQPSEGGNVPDYLIGTAEQPASAVLGSGLVCEGGFETLSRFTSGQRAGRCRSPSWRESVSTTRRRRRRAW